jgi:putative tricarboxylic transport membrane protein
VEGLLARHSLNRIRPAGGENHRQHRTPSVMCLIGALLATLLVASSSLAEASPVSGYPSGPVTMTAGANPGGGFDLTIRAVVEALHEENIVDVPLPIQNRPGASGADFLAAMVERYRGAADQISVTSLSMMINELHGVSKYGYDDVTMIARLMTEYFVVVTRADSPLNSLNDAMAAVRSDPADVEVGAAKDDEAPFDLLVKAAGGDPASVNYIGLEGGGDQITALRDGVIDVAIGGVSEFVNSLRSGDLKALGVLSENRLPGLDVPTAREQGLDVTLANWRGLYGPPDMPDFAVAYWQRVLGQMVQSPTWNRIAEEKQFTTTFMVGDDLQTFLADTQADVRTALG